MSDDEGLPATCGTRVSQPLFYDWDGGEGKKGSPYEEDWPCARVVGDGVVCVLAGGWGHDAVEGALGVGVGFVGILADGSADAAVVAVLCGVGHDSAMGFVFCIAN